MKSQSHGIIKNTESLIRHGMAIGLLITAFSLTGCAGHRMGLSPRRSGDAVNEPTDRDVSLFDRRKESSSSEITLDEDSTIEDYFQFALENNQSLKAADQRRRAAAERPAQARALPDPRISLQADTSFLSRELSVGQTFPWYGKRALRGGIQESAARIEDLRYQARELEVREELRNAYGEYYYLSRAIETTRENLDLLNFFQEIVNRRFEAGEVSRADVIRVEVENEKQRDRLEELIDQRRPRAAGLNRVLGRTHSASLPWPVELPEEGLESLKEVELIEQAFQENPRLKALRHEIERRGKQKELAEKEYWPDVTVGIMRMEEGMGGMSDDINAAMVSINLPLWRDKYDAGVREAEAGVEAGERVLSDSRYQVEAGLENAFFTFRDAERRTALYQKHLLPKAEESLSVSENAYRAADIDIIELLDAQREWLNFALEIERAKTDRFKAIGEIERLVGRVLQ